ncbi:hypothetical protein Tco_0999330 [Tanacetum coccineum]
MAAPVIPILSDSFEESVGSHVPRVILFGAIPAIIPVIPGVPAEVPIVPADLVVAPEVGAVSVTSPARVLDLVDYSSSDSDPSEDSLPPALELPLVSPFLCSDDSEAGQPSSPSGSSYDDTFAPSSELPIAPVVAPPGIRRRAAILKIFVHDRFQALIMEYLVKISKKARILELKRRNMQITVLTYYTPYPSRKIWRICACTSPKTTREQGSIRRIQRSLYAVFKLW